MLLDSTDEVSSWQESPRLEQLAQGNCLLHLNFRDRQKRHETGRERDGPDRFFSTRRMMLLQHLCALASLTIVCPVRIKVPTRLCGELGALD